MNPDDLWGELPEPATNVKTPVQILKEQASLLAAKTKGALVGEVLSTSGTPDRPFAYRLRMRAPALNEYTVCLLAVWYGPDMYPLTYAADDVQGKIECADEGQFLQALGATLKGARVRKAIEFLLLQSKTSEGGVVQEPTF